ncbi:hypothetical protein JNM05_00810 [bacterium]|nr:hypothetical protein [bacterium]
MNSRILVVLSVLMFAVGCGDDSSDQSRNIRWADIVIAYSTQYDSVEWAAYQALGAPDTYPNYGDIETAWTSEYQDLQREFLELGYYDNPEPVRSIAIFETYNPGFVDTVYVKNPLTSLWEVVYQDSAKDAGDSSRIFIINFPISSFKVSEIRLAMDMVAVPGWNEIDAVGISSDIIPPYTDTTFWAPILKNNELILDKPMIGRKKK